MHTDSEKVAKAKAPAAWSELLEAWEAKLAGHTADAEKYFDAAKQLAQARGFRYLPAGRVAPLPIKGLLVRVEAVRNIVGWASKIAVAAILGGVTEPALTVTCALEVYWGLAKDNTLGESEDQFRRWKNPRLQAAKNFVEVVGNKPISEITGDDMLDFCQWWVERIEAENLPPNSANKDLVHLADVLKTLNWMKHSGLVLPRGDLALKRGEKQ
ncbi:MAG: hypothetical protein V4586_07200 [Pseudomonadota bacterium]